MSTSRPVLLALAALGLGLAPLSAHAAPPPRPAPVQADDDQQQEAYLASALEDEEAFRGQRARLLRLHALAWEDNDTKRVTELERLLKRLYSGHMRRMNGYRKHLTGTWSDQLEERVVERREQVDERRDAGRDHREERHDARTDRRSEHQGAQADRRAEPRTPRTPRTGSLVGGHAVRNDGQAERREARRPHRTPRHDGQSSSMAGSEPKRAPASPRRINPNGDPVRLDGAADRRPVGHASHLTPGRGGQRVGAVLGKRRPVPPSRPAPGMGLGVRQFGGMTGATGTGASHRGTAGRAPSRRLSSRREAETRAAATISRANAEAEYRRLVKELETDEE